MAQSALSFLIFLQRTPEIGSLFDLRRAHHARIPYSYLRLSACDLCPANDGKKRDGVKKKNSSEKQRTRNLKTERNTTRAIRRDCKIQPVETRRRIYLGDVEYRPALYIFHSCYLFPPALCKIRGYRFFFYFSSFFFLFSFFGITLLPQFPVRFLIHSRILV